MESVGQYVLPLTVLFAVVGILFVVLAVWLERRRDGRPENGKPKNRRGPVAELPCPTCQRPLQVHRNDLAPLSASEMALMVSALRRDAGRQLGSYRCPYCESEHTFVMDRRIPEWLASDTFEPHRAGAYCADCRQPLIRPTWPKGTYDGRVLEAPDLQPKHGLVCPRCGAICCVECCKKATRNRTPDKSLLCPRCFRGPVQEIYHW